ncbi:adenosine kinase [Hyphococcus flavus]|uniref:Adenosine kinase n=1 Tax=Hyphococcus flavus TaxID=1866326 RepID=A0AAE9ZHM0_9PROT|nr:adenosine kinase [Hyphococcus flavus]WDI32752.1 adenosine kinase [Hyphococcus flavus]
MPQTDLDVIGVGNAIVDVLAKADDAFLAQHDIVKGGMVLIDEEQAKSVYDAMAPGVEISGGSAANSVACVASLGGKGGFIGKVADDALGEIFRHDLKALGVEFSTAPLQNGPATGRCLINVTPDAQRSMTTFLGAAGYASIDDIDPDQIARAAIIFFEGYLFEPETPRQAFYKAAEIAQKNKRRTALTLSDSGCVERQFDAFNDFIDQHIDILLANETEAAALFQTGDMNAIIEKAKNTCELTVVTRSEKGSILIPREGEVIAIDAVTPEKLEDTTGAGDAYAAGLLFGLAQGFPLARAGALGSLAASEVISHFGARPAQSLKAMAQSAELL